MSPDIRLGTVDLRVTCNRRKEGLDTQSAQVGGQTLSAVTRLEQTTGVAELDTTRLEPRDRAYAESLGAEEQKVVLSTVLRFRHPDRLQVGDPLPSLELVRLEDGRAVRVDTLADDRPLVLVFGSYT